MYAPNTSEEQFYYTYSDSYKSLNLFFFNFTLRNGVFTFAVQFSQCGNTCHYLCYSLQHCIKQKHRIKYGKIQNAVQVIFTALNTDRSASTVGNCNSFKKKLRRQLAKHGIRSLIIVWESLTDRHFLSEG